MALIKVGMPIGPRPAISTVLRSNNEAYKPGDKLWCRVVYETFSILDPALIMKKIAPPEPSYPLTMHIGPLGWIGMTG